MSQQMIHRLKLCVIAMIFMLITGLLYPLTWLPGAWGVLGFLFEWFMLIAAIGFALAGASKMTNETNQAS